MWSWLVIGLLSHRRRVAPLDRVELATADVEALPSLSVIVAARDEAASIERTVTSLLSQGYPELEVVAVDDRSGDGTGEILDRLARADARLRVVHVDSLPAGWLGKNNASAVGSRLARGRYLLFTDGDVVFEPSALQRAVGFAQVHGLGHLVVFPRLVAPGLLERAFVSAFGILLLLRTRAWTLHLPKTPAYVGVGAFNLVRRDAYERVGGHSRVAMEVVDDVKLGLILRRSGVPQGAIEPGGLVSVRWQQGLLASFRGLLKNAFAAAEYSWSQVGLGAVVVGLAYLAPLLAAVNASMPVRLVGIVAAAAIAVIHGLAARRAASGSGLEGLLFPVSGLALIGVMLASATLATWRQSITWKGTRYPLSELRAGCVREADWPRQASVGWPGSAT